MTGDAVIDGEKSDAIYGRQSHKKDKSISEQVKLGLACWPDARVYTDGGSASPFSDDARDDWERLLDDLEAGRIRRLWLWHSNRGDRTLETWARFLRLCRDGEVLIWIEVDEHLYDLSRARDWKVLAEAGVEAEGFSHELSVAVRRGVLGAAIDGKPHGHVPYGYERIYDPATREFVEQRPHPVQASIVIEIVTRLAKGDSVMEVWRDLNERGIPAPRGGSWAPTTVAKVARNLRYVGKRVHKGKIYDACWPPITGEEGFEEAFWETQRLLTDPARKRIRPGRPKYLLTYLINCDVCEGRVQARPRRSRKKQPATVVPVPFYVCQIQGCVAMKLEWVDGFIEDLICAKARTREVYEWIARADDSEGMAARVEADQLRAKLNEYYALARADKLTPEGLASAEAGLLPKIKDAEVRSKSRVVPASLRGLADPNIDVREAWESLSLAAKREVVRLLIEEITLSKHVGPPMGRRPVFNPERVKVTWRKLDLNLAA